MPIFDHFDVLAPIYETFIQPKDPEEIIALANLPTSGALLDAGGGTGRVSQFFHDQAKTVVVADLSYEMLAVEGKKRCFAQFVPIRKNYHFLTDTLCA